MIGYGGYGIPRLPVDCNRMNCDAYGIILGVIALVAILWAFFVWAKRGPSKLDVKVPNRLFGHSTVYREKNRSYYSGDKPGVE